MGQTSRGLLWNTCEETTSKPSYYHDVHLSAFLWNATIAMPHALLLSVNNTTSSIHVPEVT